MYQYGDRVELKSGFIYFVFDKTGNDMTSTISQAN